MKILALGFSFLASRWPARPETSRRAMSLREPQTRASEASRMVEAGGIEPPSEGTPPKTTTCLADALISSSNPPKAGS